jgi:hypothetical protein
MFIGCEPQKTTSNAPERIDKSCIEYCVFDLVNKIEWHGIEADKAWKYYDTYKLRSCDDNNNVFEVETEYGGFIRSEFCSTCKFKGGS